MAKDFSRIVVYGSTSAGKTTVTKELGRILDSDVIILDDVFWGLNWEMPTTESFQKKVINRLSLRLKRKLAQRGGRKINKKLETLFQTSNSTFGLLVNIEILKEMGRLIGVEMDPIMTDSFQTELISILEDM